MKNVKNEIFNFLSDIFDICLPFKNNRYNKMIYFISSKEIERLKKLNSIYKKESESISILNDDHICYFILETKYKILWIDDKKIYTVLHDKYNISNEQITILIKCWLLDIHKFNKNKIPIISFNNYKNYENKNMKQLNNNEYKRMFDVFL